MDSASSNDQENNDDDQNDDHGARADVHTVILSTINYEW
jgi:hypothetical protein